MKPYTDIFFDLDRTLWDFERNSEETLILIFSEFRLGESTSAMAEDFAKAYKKANAKIWADFHKTAISKDQMRISRFEHALKKINVSDKDLAGEISEYYLRICPNKSHLVDGAVEILDYLESHYRLHILSNGFSESQRSKIAASGIESYFENIFISDETGYRKPQKEIFLKAIKDAGTDANKGLMIGDDWINDIVGAKKIGMDQVYFDQERGYISRNRPTYQIGRLEELKGIL